MSITTPISMPVKRAGMNRPAIERPCGRGDPRASGTRSSACPAQVRDGWQSGRRQDHGPARVPRLVQILAVAARHKLLPALMAVAGGHPQ